MSGQLIHILTKFRDQPRRQIENFESGLRGAEAYAEL